MSTTYTIHRFTGQLLKDGVLPVVQDDRDPAYQDYAEWLRAGGTVQLVGDEDPSHALQEELALLAEARAWGTVLVREYEAAAMRAGINADPAQALALYRFLEPVRTPLREGLLHVAYAALQELLAFGEEGQPPLAPTILLAVHHALATRLGLPEQK